jgi:hypothetical protein
VIGKNWGCSRQNCRGEELERSSSRPNRSSCRPLFIVGPQQWHIFLSINGRFEVTTIRGEVNLATITDGKLEMRGPPDMRGVVGVGVISAKAHVERTFVVEVPKQYITLFF